MNINYLWRGLLFMYFLFPFTVLAGGDHGSTFAEATALTVDAADVNGEIEVQGDVDWFKFTAVAGTAYSIQVNYGSIVSTHINLYDTDGTTPITNNIGQVLWNATVSGEYYINVRGFNNVEIGTYSIGVQSYSDDHSSSFDNATLLTVGDAPTAGSIEILGDLDFFQFTALEGLNYSIQGSSQNLPTFRIRLSKETYISQGSCGTTVASATAGTHYVQVDSRNNTGEYDIAVNTYVDDHGNDAQSATAVIVDDPAINGILEVNGESDWFSFSAATGFQYQISAIPVPNNSPIQRYANVSIYDSTGKFLQNGFNGIVWQSPSDGTFYAAVEYRSCNGNNAVSDYTFSVNLRAEDDHGDSYDVATPITTNSTTNGIMDSIGDSDWFVFTPQVNQSYSILVDSNEFVDRSIELYDADGTTELSNNKSGISWSCKAPCTGDRYIRVYSASAQTGAYTITLESFTDDHGNSPAEATAVTVDADAISGNIDKPADIDWFSFSADAGQHFKITANGEGLSTIFMILHDTDGLAVLERALTANASTQEIIWQFQQSGTYYVQVFNLAGNGETGTYSIQVNTYTPPVSPPPAKKSGSLSVILPILLLLYLLRISWKRERLRHQIEVSKS